VRFALTVREVSPPFAFALSGSTITKAVLTYAD
jgi:hypothetical protein